jgi:hypothetical protein
MRQTSLNIVQLAVVLLCVMVLVAVLLPMLNTRRPARRMQNSTQLRGIHQGLVTYANANKNYFPGLNELGEDDRISVEERFQILLEDDYFTPEYAISPYETESITEWEEGVGDDTNPVTKDNYSYAMLQVPKEGGRRMEWSQTLNQHAILLSDRNTGTRAKPSSIYAEKGEPWKGSVLWNDNHVAFEDDDAIETYYGQFDPDKDELNPADRLFEAAGYDDALLIHTGNEMD